LSTVEPEVVRPAEFCRKLLGALDVSDGRRKRRARNTTPDTLGMEIKRELIAQVVAADPEPEDFERWLFEYCGRSVGGAGAVRAMAIDTLHEWRLVSTSGSFRQWLDEGAPSDDLEPT